jgi:hypothetical protein
MTTAHSLPFRIEHTAAARPAKPAPVATRVANDELDRTPVRCLLRRALTESLGDLHALSPLDAPAVDGTTQLLARSRAGPQSFLVTCAEGDVAAKLRLTAESADHFKEALPVALRTAVLAPIARGEIGGLFYAVYPRCVPVVEPSLASLPRRFRMRRPALRWLLDVAKATRVVPGTTDAFAAPLTEMAESPAMPRWVRDEAMLALNRLHCGWLPRHVLTHFDLSDQNLLLHTTERDPASHGLRIADWTRARIDGFPLLDLLCLTETLNLSTSVLRRELVAHCDLLGCDTANVRSYLLAALGDLGMRQRGAPFADYRTMCERMLTRVNATGL